MSKFRGKQHIRGIWKIATSGVRKTVLGKRNGKRAWSVMDRDLQDSVRNNAKQEEDERRIMSTPPDPNRPHPMMEKPKGKKTI